MVIITIICILIVLLLFDLRIRLLNITELLKEKNKQKDQQ
jgi:hypothetical protein